MIDPKIRQHSVRANGIDIHVAEAGQGRPVIFCHGFPESWYSWRHQLVDLADAGYRAIAPDMRGYGRTSAPDDVADYSIFHLVGDMVGLLDALEIESATIIGHDWGAPVAWNTALLRPDRFHAVGALSVPFMPRGPMSGVEAARRAGRTGFYQLYFQEPGRADAELAADPETSMRRFLWTLSGGPEQPWGGVIGAEGTIESLWEPTGDMPWLTADDLHFYTEAFKASGFTGPLNWYRNIDRNWALMSPFQGAIVQQPALFVIGEKDGVYNMYRGLIESLSNTLPNLRKTVVIPGIGHWAQQEAPATVSESILSFLREIA
ncbi:hypothetical protein A0J57_09070 [Sphingobium sp. 22B]|uniref:alpha/beta fold hydrolase n=1 Tax=unclassified Sphingobium TaxID=2611147 RepID=UPI0007817109|nr:MULTISPECIES: alpha/beta hydrolase [unclassified Sphingobium]KXU32718.1 hypothetical protein AXW74_06560 [Sphingobium sp. AM]KYC32799.1 hypothetical protein A0J57_09070 [Sphingobium sp. 22B]OAP31685.1 hypothetical protein A8O16_12525 [Sphingobium sp. 20006FA]